MALNKIFASTQELHRDRPLTDIAVPAATTTIQPGVPVLIGAAAASARPAVSLTASGNGTKTETNIGGGITSVTFSNGGVGNGASPASASFAFDGTFEFAVTGATTSTASEVLVYITSAGALTLTAGSNTLYGRTDYPVGYRKEADRAPVKIGA